MSLDPYLPDLRITETQYQVLLDLKWDSQLESQPEEVQFCRRCVMSNQRPRITLDSSGMCGACRYWERKSLISWPTRQSELESLLSEARRSDGGYDVLVPGSGGKDSAYVAHQLKHRWNMNPLTVTWSPASYTDIGRANLEAFVHSGFDNLKGTPNGLLHRKLTLLSTAIVGDNFLPFIWGQISFVFHVARAFEIPLIFFGENGEAEYGGSPEVEDLPGMPPEKWSDNYWKGVTPDQLLRVGQEIGLVSETEAAQITRFYSPPLAMEEAFRPRHFWYGYFNEWRPQENYYYCTENTGFRANPEGRSEATYSKYASLDDRFDGFHYLFGLLKFGLGRASSDAAHEIREGLIDRREAIALIQRYEMEFPSRNLDFFLSYIGITKPQFESITDKFRSEHLWIRSNDSWRLRYPIWEATDG